jgi:hypothetical protein
MAARCSIENCPSAGFYSLSPGLVWSLRCRPPFPRARCCTAKPARHLPSLPAACCPARRQAHNKALNVQHSFRRQRCTPPAASSAASAASTWHGAPEAESAPIEGETRRPNLASSQTGCAPSTWTSRGGIPGPASDLAHRRLITAIYPPTVCAARWHRLFTSPAHARPPCRRRRRRRHCHGLRDQVPRGLRRRRRV